MTPSVSVSMSQTMYRLGSSYTGYRLITSASLILIFLLTLNNQTLHYESPGLYLYSLIIYAKVRQLIEEYKQKKNIKKDGQ